MYLNRLDIYIYSLLQKMMNFLKTKRWVGGRFTWKIAMHRTWDSIETPQPRCHYYPLPLCKYNWGSLLLSPRWLDQQVPWYIKYNSKLKVHIFGVVGWQSSISIIYIYVICTSTTSNALNSWVCRMYSKKGTSTISNKIVASSSLSPGFLRGFHNPKASSKWWWAYQLWR